jgi:hypothetical protein
MIADADASCDRHSRHRPPCREDRRRNIAVASRTANATGREIDALPTIFE